MNKKSSDLVSRFVQLFVLMILIACPFFGACNRGSEESIFGEKFIESQTEFNLIDTLSVNLSTVILDTVVTSGTGSVLIGNYQDDIFGKITSHSYMQIVIPDEVDIQDDDCYDSLNLMITYNQLFFGDTTKIQKIFVHQLTENIEYNYGSTICSQTTFQYNPEPIGSIVYTPGPSSSNNTLLIRISDDVGLDFFKKLRDDSEIINDNETFNRYFHELVILADDGCDGSIMGFEADEYSTGLKLYTTVFRILQKQSSICLDYINLQNSSIRLHMIFHQPL